MLKMSCNLLKTSKRKTCEISKVTHAIQSTLVQMLSLLVTIFVDCSNRSQSKTYRPVGIEIVHQNVQRRLCILWISNILSEHVRLQIWREKLHVSMLRLWSSQNIVLTHKLVPTFSFKCNSRAVSRWDCLLSLIQGKGEKKKKVQYLKLLKNTGC